MAVESVAGATGGDIELGLEPGVDDTTPGVGPDDDLAAGAGVAGGDTELGLALGPFGGLPLVGIGASGVSSLS